MVIFVIKEIRKKKNINLYRLSKLTGLTRSYLRDLENNRKNNSGIDNTRKFDDTKWEELIANETNKKLNTLNNYFINNNIIQDDSKFVENCLNIDLYELLRTLSSNKLLKK